MTEGVTESSNPPTETKTINYKKLYTKLEKEYNAQVEQSENLLNEFDTLRFDYTDIVTKINSLLDVLFFLTETLHQDDDETDETGLDSKEKLIQAQKAIVEDKSRLISLKDHHSELKALDNLIEGDFKELKDRENFRNLLLMNHPLASNHLNDFFQEWVDTLGIINLHEKKRPLESAGKKESGAKRRKN